jgi:predicted ABC-type ATPase
MPSLYVLGGANGVGKTTWYHTGIEQGYISKELPFINIDNIALKELGGYTAENIARAEELGRQQMTTLIREGKDFMIESNLSKTADYDWIAAMRKQGYDTVLFFLSTNNVEINKERVQQRVIEGGHDIAAPIIEHRHSMSLTYIKSKLLDFTEARLIDVSTDRPREMAHLRQRQILYQHPEIENWAKESLHIAERLQQRQQLKEEQEELQLRQRNKGLGL